MRKGEHVLASELEVQSLRDSDTSPSSLSSVQESNGKEIHSLQLK